MLDRISRLIVGDGGIAREATTALAESYIDCAGRATQLSRHAEMAPQHASTELLEELAKAEEEQRDRLRQALEAAGAPVPSIPATAPRGASNHWARLVQDLEAHRIAVQRFRELAMRLAEALPQTAGLFELLCREEARHCEDLRTLIARADPQALD